jgi:hypothetical protein
MSTDASQRILGHFYYGDVDSLPGNLVNGADEATLTLAVHRLTSFLPRVPAWML